MPLALGELEMDNFFLNVPSRTTGEPVLEEPDRSMDWLLTVRSRGIETGATGRAISGTVASVSGNSEYQSWELEMRWSGMNIGEHSKLSFK